MNAFQLPGKGDGSDGRPNNLLCLAVPGQPNSLLPGDLQDAKNVSTRGQGINEWMAAVADPTPPIDTSRKIFLRKS
jgi:hypothetical protein